MTEKQSSVHHVRNASGTRLGLTHYPGKPVSANAARGSTVADGQHAERSVVILAHGTFSNHRSCRGLAGYLAKNGFDCWMLDFQGHGVSERPVRDPSFESMCLEDADAAISFVLNRYPTQQIHWVGHSGGGLAILMYLARNPHQQASIRSVVTLASQATHAAVSRRNRLAIVAASLVTRVLGFAPGRWFGIGPEHEFGPVMAQWYEWSLLGRWLGSDGFDYEEALATLSRPLLCLAAEADTFIAPQSGCFRIFEQYQSDTKAFQVCGLSTGFLENYSHARLISSSSAAKEIWPQVLRWLGKADSQSSELTS